MKILLLNPPSETLTAREGRCQNPGDWWKGFNYPQLSLACIGGILEQSGFKPKLIDGVATGMSVDELLNIVSVGYDIIIMNTSTVSIDSDMETIKKIKIMSPATIIAAFGTHLTVLHNEILKSNPALDVVIRGEPEMTALELCQAIRDSKNFLKVKGTSAQKDSKIYVNKTREWIEDLDSLPWPARHLLPNNLYYDFYLNRRHTLVQTARGCPFQCIFCVARIYYGDQSRFRSPKSVLDEIEFEVVKNGFKAVTFWADTFTLKRDFVMELCKGLIDRKIDIKWFANSRAGTIDMEMLKLMKKSGCVGLSIGIESGVQELLDVAKKGTTIPMIRDSVRMIKDSGINVITSFLCGLPGETKETFKKTVDFAKELNPDFATFNPLIPYPGTELYDIVNGKNMITSTEWNKYACGGYTSVLRTEELSTEELNKLIRNAYRSFYLKPSYVFSVLKKIKSPEQFFRWFVAGANFLKHNAF
ncbi:MAG: B12-binding domain-containing radical SAM protein [Nanoarchaeota archaeon]|nr:B12-binding domain-containing radical SAM protein [Nanoarchaeota archaeon]MBU1135680.1 B12-binding domain-containing radical SAM protein [Nanoarchaeota archaeon]MBU2520554.1 B12-binding domain-containing radical SAM protein [Nanoarchaeota archaeon]